MTVTKWVTKCPEDHHAPSPRPRVPKGADGPNSHHQPIIIAPVCEGRDCEEENEPRSKDTTPEKVDAPADKPSFDPEISPDCSKESPDNNPDFCGDDGPERGGDGPHHEHEGEGEHHEGSVEGEHHENEGEHHEGGEEEGHHEHRPDEECEDDKV